MTIALRNRRGFDSSWIRASSEFNVDKVSSLQSPTRNARSMAWCGYVSSESSEKCCRKWDAASRSGVRISTRSWVLARVMLSRFMYSIVSETMVSGSCGLCRFGMSSGILSSGPNFATLCADSWQTNLYCVNHIEDAIPRIGCIVKIITFAYRCYLASRVEALRTRR